MPRALIDVDSPPYDEAATDPKKRGREAVNPPKTPRKRQYVKREKNTEPLQEPAHAPAKIEEPPQQTSRPSYLWEPVPVEHDSDDHMKILWGECFPTVDLKEDWSLVGQDLPPPDVLFTTSTFSTQPPQNSTFPAPSTTHHSKPDFCWGAADWKGVKSKTKLKFPKSQVADINGNHVYICAKCGSRSKVRFMIPYWKDDADKTFEEKGCFCGFSCCLDWLDGFLEDSNMEDITYRSRVNLQFQWELSRKRGLKIPEEVVHYRESCPGKSTEAYAAIRGPAVIKQIEAVCCGNGFSKLAMSREAEMVKAAKDKKRLLLEHVLEKMCTCCKKLVTDEFTFVPLPERRNHSQYMAPKSTTPPTV